MKLFYRKSLALFLIVGFAFNAKAVNDTLTIGQVFDWSVGDTFLYRGYTIVAFMFPDTVSIYPTQGFTVLGKVSDADSIVYEIKSFPHDTITYLHVNHLDSPITSFQLQDYFFQKFWWGLCSCDSTASCANQQSIDSQLNFQTFSNSSSINYGGSCYSLVEEKIGLKNANRWSNGDPNNGIPPVGQYINLVYYSSSNKTWIDSTLYSRIPEQTSSPSFHLSPNPASDEITITTEAQNGAAFDTYIYDLTGNCVVTHKNLSATLQNIKVNSLPPGYYFLKVTDEHANSAVKSFIVAR